jgi:nicotinamidase/pyrazinamidase
MYRDTILWDEDTQVDFMLPGGKLYAPGAERIVPQLRKLTQHARDSHILVVASVDAHQPADAEFSQWPPHCVMGTPGQQKIPETRMARTFVLPNAPAELPQDLSRFEQILVEKQAVDVFTNPNVEALLSRLGKPEVTLYGVVTEVCVHIAAMGLLDRGYRIRVVTDAIWPFQPEAGDRSLAEWKRRGAQFVTADEVLQRQEPRLTA